MKRRYISRNDSWFPVLIAGASTQSPPVQNDQTQVAEFLRFPADCKMGALKFEVQHLINDKVLHDDRAELRAVSG